MTLYGQFCPIAKTMEVLDERWTVLVVRELLRGSTRFNELRRGVPRMSPALLSRRLGTLERAGLLERSVEGGRSRYTLTAAGRDLEPVVAAVGRWGQRWVGELGDEDLDPHLLMWDIKRTVALDTWPRARTVLAFELEDVGHRVGRWWLVVADGEIDLCDADPGFDIDVTVATSLRELTRIWLDTVTWQAALRSGSVRISGPSEARRAVPTWLGQGMLARGPA